MHLSVALILAAIPTSSCQDRLANGPPEEEHNQYCAPVNAARVYDDEGNQAGLVRDEEGNQTWLCWCLTLEEATSSEQILEVNEAAYETCLTNAATMGYTEANDCEHWYSINHWGGTMFAVWPPHRDIICEPESEDAAGGCSVR